jgi:hypothetical protein
LEWLIGKWADDGADGVRIETDVRWSDGEAFLLRTFILHSADGTEKQGTQIIGYDPRAHQIRSWSFNADGSFGDGVWTKSGEEWSIKSSQTLADGQAASGTYVLKRVNANTLSLQLVGHEIEGEPQPAGKAATVTRLVEEKKPVTAPKK